MMLKTIDLFAGAGGLSLGFKMTGKFELVAAAEINGNARATYKKNLVRENRGFTFIENVVVFPSVIVAEDLFKLKLPAAKTLLFIIKKNNTKAKINIFFNTFLFICFLLLYNVKLVPFII